VQPASTTTHITARRTRSGTVVGPLSKAVPIPAPVLGGRICLSSKGRGDDDELMIIGDEILDDEWILCKGEVESSSEVSSGSSEADELNLRDRPGS
jgi:hypothetical protein